MLDAHKPEDLEPGGGRDLHPDLTALGSRQRSALLASYIPNRVSEAAITAA
jgi:hypothetical protein